jgi:hypothetical protein
VKPEASIWCDFSLYPHFRFVFYKQKNIICFIAMQTYKELIPTTGLLKLVVTGQKLFVVDRFGAGLI